MPIGRQHASLFVDPFATHFGAHLPESRVHSVRNNHDFAVGAHRGFDASGSIAAV